VTDDCEGYDAVELVEVAGASVEFAAFIYSAEY
jgi:hypothetical protein